MNILIVGNGFDLSHYLPTKYDHFMIAMDAIENGDIAKGEMGFDDLFIKDYWHKNNETEEEWQNSFFQHTKAMYKTEEIKISVDEVEKLQNQLKENVWYQYFSEHVREVKTWIDFELKIEEALNILSGLFANIYQVYESKGKFDYDISLETLIEDQIYKISKRRFDILNLLGIFKKNERFGCNIPNGFGKKDKIAGYFSPICFIVPDDGTLGFNYSKYMSMLHSQLDEFTKIFNLYLELIVDRLEPKVKFKIESKDWIQPDHIFSFNYTNTFRKFYESEVKAEFLHGRFGEKQNIVLGVSDLEDESLKKLKAYGFTKYHQKLFKDTEYLFLDHFKESIESGKRKFENDLKLLSANALNSVTTKFIQMGRGDHNVILDLNFSIWGHSLDSSDKDYINDLFCLNDDMDRRVRVVVYYYDDNAKFMLLNNLLAILGKDKVEKWMKNKWLIFEKNPEVKF